MRLALIGYGNVGRALARLLEQERTRFPFTVTGIHTARHGTAIDREGLAVDAPLGPASSSVEEFLDRADSDAVVELSTLNPETGEPALSHIRAAFARRRHVVTANKGPIAHAYRELEHEAASAGVQLRFESTVMDGAPVFYLFRNNLPGVRVLGFTGILNSTSQVVVDVIRAGGTKAQGIAAARKLGITETDPSYDLDGWDSVVKTAVLANVFLDARVTPLAVKREGLGRFTDGEIQDLARSGKTICLVSRGERNASEVDLSVRAEVLDEGDLLASLRGTSNLILFRTDLMGTIGTVSISSGVEQTAYGVFADLIDIYSGVRK